MMFRSPPMDYKRLDSMTSGMSNFDGKVKEGFEDLLRTNKVIGSHAAWNFHGQVWFEGDGDGGGMFHETVLVYQVPQATFSADTLENLMKIVNDRFGHE
jgi:hypothetical protein